jgi:hypothetical protein
MSSQRKTGVALYDCTGADKSELSFRKGQRFTEGNSFYKEGDGSVLSIRRDRRMTSSSWRRDEGNVSGVCVVRFFFLLMFFMDGLLVVRETEDPGWLEARLVDNGQVGLVPANYVRTEMARNVVCSIEGLFSSREKGEEKKSKMNVVVVVVVFT